MSPQLPLCSSEQVVRVLRQLGFEEAKRNPGSHQRYVKKTAERTYVVTVVLGKKEIPRGTLKSILERAHVTPDEFIRLLK